MMAVYFHVPVPITASFVYGTPENMNKVIKSVGVDDDDDDDYDDDDDNDHDGV